MSDIHEERSAAEAAAEIRKQVGEMQSAAFDRAAAYTNVIVLAGYAGLFTIWGFQTDQLSHASGTLIAILLGVSLLAFVLFEVYKMAHLVRLQMPVVNLIKQGHDDDPVSWLQEFERLKSEQKVASLIAYFTIWIVTLVITLTTGLAAAGLLFYNFAAYLLGWPAFPADVTPAAT